MTAAMLYVFMVMANLEHMSTAVSVDTMNECRTRAQQVVQLSERDDRVLWGGAVCVPVNEEGSGD